MTFSVRLFNSTYVFLLMELFSQLILAIGPKLKHHIYQGCGTEESLLCCIHHLNGQLLIIWIHQVLEVDIPETAGSCSAYATHEKNSWYCSTVTMLHLMWLSSAWLENPLAKPLLSLSHVIAQGKCPKCLQSVFSFSCFHPTIVECLACIAINKSDLFPVAAGPCLGCPLSLTLFIIFLSTAKYGGWAAAG